MTAGRSFAVTLSLLLCACERRSADTTWHDAGAYAWRELDVPARGHAGFDAIVGTDAGLPHRNDVDDAHALQNRQLLIGAGVAAGDIDGDGLPDLFLASVERPAALYRNRGGFRFEDVTATSGIDTRGLATLSAAFADVNGDGAMDLVVGTLGGPIKLWLGDGKGHFTDATAASGLPAGFAATGLTFADVDGDGDLDLYVATYKVRNVQDEFPPQQREFDQVVRKVGDRYEVVPQWRKDYRIEDHPELGGVIRSQRAEPDLFLENDGSGHFSRIPMAHSRRFLDASGKPLDEEPDYFTLAARFYDVNGDGAPDLYACNDFEDPDQLWLSDGHGGFRLASALELPETSNTCMSVDFGDIDRDGRVDFFTADMLASTRARQAAQIATNSAYPKAPGLARSQDQWMQNMLQLARGDGGWGAISDVAGVAATDWTWGSAFVDADLDGYEDLVMLNGHRWDVRDADTYERLRNALPRVPWNREQAEFPRSATRNFVFRNAHDLTFTDMSRAWGIANEDAISQGIAVGDLDGDGDADIVATRLDAPVMLYRNRSTAPRVEIALQGVRPNTAGIGATITVRARSLPAQTREVTAGGYYLSGSPPAITFATRSDTAVTIDVRWRSGLACVVANARPNRAYVVKEAACHPEPLSRHPEPLSRHPERSEGSALFEDATRLLRGHTHVDSAFDDFQRQSLLPNRFSQLGPGVSWIDVDGDGRADLVVGAGRGARVSVLHNDGGGFSTRTVGAQAAGDITTILPVPAARGLQLIAGQSNYESASAAQALAVPRVVALSAGSTPILSPAGDSASVGPLALADVNGDGRLDLFVGARVVGGNWPVPAPSRLYLRTAAGGWNEDTSNARALAVLGLVSSAIFTDLDGDGWPELVATSEWGPIRILHNDRGVFRDATREWGLSGMSSRWNGAAAGDFDGDGRMDLVVTSWGRNTPWQATPNRPYELLVGDFGGVGLGLLFARQDSATRTEMPLQSFDRVQQAVPAARARVGTYAQFARASVDDILGDRARTAIRVGATTFDNILLLNRGGTFAVRPLPARAQLAPAFAPVVADFDGDGREDVFLAQNFSATSADLPRFDAGSGLLLLGDGAGGFRARSVDESGIAMRGDQRGAAVSDYDGDGRVDLAVGENAAPTRLWHNVGARPGLRVKLDGGVENPWGVGAQLRLGNGPVREIRLGSGYWSADDPVIVLARSSGDLWIRWPGGEEQRVAVPADQREIVVHRPRP
ncbi:MAG TPA: VCBS repeat-containing protein [Gemmatimonadaceae bacterium]|nr:VCBS repeat-containing protein [Gemmatimonadaceae bacterium]